MSSKYNTFYACPACRGRMRLTEPATVSLPTAGDYVQIDGTFANGEALKFEVTAEGKLKWLGQDNAVFHFVGVSDAAVDKACELTYGLFKNGVLVENAETPHTFPASSRTQNLSITDLLKLNKNDEIEVRAKSDTAATTLTVRTLVLTLYGGDR